MSSKTIHICDICHKQLAHPTKRGRIELRRNNGHGPRFQGDMCDECERVIDGIIQGLSDENGDGETRLVLNKSTDKFTRQRSPQPAPKELNRGS